MYNKCLYVLYIVSFSILVSKGQNTLCGNDPSLCYFYKKFDSNFEIRLNNLKVSNAVVSNFQTPILVDVNSDCIPEIFTTNNNEFDIIWSATNLIEIFDSQTLEKKQEIKTDFFIYQLNNFIIYDVDGDGKYEIIIPSADIPTNPALSRGKLICYNLDGTIKWISDQKYGQNSGFANQGSISITDFNADNIPEIYIFNEVFSAVTGIKLVDGGSNGCGLSFTSQTIAANLDFETNDLELAAGYTIYKVSITNINGTSGNFMYPSNLNINSNFIDGKSIICDINLDGILDVLTCTSTTNFSGIYAYYLDNSNVKLISQYKFNQFKSLGSVSFGAISKNGNRILISSRDTLRCFSFVQSTNMFEETWKLKINDSSINIGVSLFDFNSDGFAEIVLRDENEILIINAVDDYPIIIARAPCLSSTLFEAPTIADIDGTGQAKICVTCADNINDRNGRLTIFGPPPGQRWAPARKIWHQYAYNPLFINDDGTVPQYMHNPATYKNGKYNNFMVQESLIDEDGNYPVPAASLTGIVSCMDYDIATQQYTVDFSVANRADASASALSGLPVTFYNGNPEAGGSLIGMYRTSADISAGNTLSGLSYSFSANDLTSLWMIVNNDKYPIIVSDTSYYDIDECDYTDNIFIAPAPKFTESSQEICQGDSYTFYGNVLNTSGTYFHEIADVSGCDSVIARLDLQVSNIKMQSLTTSACDTYTWNGQTYTTDGTYTYQTLSVNGCDSITTLNLVVNRSDLINQSIQSCDTHAWNGQTYTQSGTYTYRTQNIHGCDSIITLDLYVYPSADVTQTYAACDAFAWNGQTYTQSGTYTYITQTRYGCDSTVTLDLTISNILRTNHPVTACDTFMWNGVTYDTAGNYTFSGQSVQGCDSIATLQLVIHPSTNSSISQTACDAYTWNGQTYDQSGIYTYRTQNTFGCDSVATLSLTVNRASASSADINACSQYTWNGQTYTQSGTYDYQTTNIHGCDSIATLRLYIYQPDVVSAQLSACDTYIWNGQTYTQSGNYTFETQNRYGCDSITNLDLTIFPSETRTLQEKACDSLVYHGRSLTQSGIYTFDLQNRFGCDSTITLDLRISGDKISNSLSACKQYTWPIDGQTYTQSDTYTARYTNLAGCDSIYTLDLIIHPDYEIITDTEACAQYLWPTTNQRYTQSGTYTFPLKTAHGCDSTLTLDLVIHPEFEFRDTVFATEPYLWSINNKIYDISGIYSETFSTDISCDSIHYLYLTIKNTTDIYFPNIISNDGNNGFFTGYSSNTSAIIASLSIYDRWGNLLFTKENFPPNDPQQGWNGKFGGKDVVQGVFVYVVVVRLPDGSLETFSGDVTVVR